jgi:hypothetical protein
MEAPVRTCLSCRFYVPQTAKVGVLGTDGKGWEIRTEMTCQQRSGNVRELLACGRYEREPGTD